MEVIRYNGNDSALPGSARKKKSVLVAIEMVLFLRVADRSIRSDNCASKDRVFNGWSVRCGKRLRCDLRICEDQLHLRGGEHSGAGSVFSQNASMSAFCFYSPFSFVPRLHWESPLPMRQTRPCSTCSKLLALPTGSAQQLGPQSLSARHYHYIRG